MPNERQPAALPSSESFEEELYRWRKDIFLDLGFGSVQAGALSRKGTDHHRVKKMMDQGCSIDLVCGIML